MDIFTIIVIIIMSILGYKKGFTVTVMHIVSWVVAGILAVKFYPVVSTYFINNTKVYQKILTFINEKMTTIAEIAVDGTNFNISDFIKLPKVVNDMVKGLDFSSKEIVSATVGEAISKILLDVVSIIAIFVVVKLVLFVLTIILDRIADLPILKQLNNIGGLALGGLKGLILIFILLALLVPIIGITENELLISSLEKSTVTKYLYDNNIVFKIINSYFD